MSRTLRRYEIVEVELVREFPTITTTGKYVRISLKAQDPWLPQVRLNGAVLRSGFDFSIKNKSLILHPSFAVDYTDTLDVVYVVPR
jgi:hypothetical protein